MRFPSRRWRLGLLAALALVSAGALGCALMLWPSPRVTEANFEKIQVGMTREQVDAILGAGNRHAIPSNPGLEWTDLYREEDQAGAILVAFGDDGRMRNGRMCRGVVPDRPWAGKPKTLAELLRGRLAKVRRRLGL